MGLGKLFTQNSRLRLLAFVTVVAAAVVSFSSLHDLAFYAGFGGKSWLFPLCLDAVAALSIDVWLSGSAAARRGKWLAMAAILGSLAGNAADWWIKSASFLSAGLGIVPPAALALVLLVLHKHWGGTVKAASQVVPAAVRTTPRPASTPTSGADKPVVTATRKTVTKSQPSAQRVSEATAPKTSTTKANDAEKVLQLVKHAHEHGLPTRREAQDLFRQWNGVGVGTDKATALLALAREALDNAVTDAPVTPFQLHPVSTRDESDSDSTRQEAAL